MRRFFPLLLLVLVALPAVALAQEPDPKQYPVLAKERLTLGARAEYEFYAGDRSGPVGFLVNDVQKEWALGVVGAYALTGGRYPLSLVGGTIYGTDSKFYRSHIGVSIRLFSGLYD